MRVVLLLTRNQKCKTTKFGRVLSASAKESLASRALSAAVSSSPKAGSIMPGCCSNDWAQQHSCDTIQKSPVRPQKLFARAKSVKKPGIERDSRISACQIPCKTGLMSASQQLSAAALAHERHQGRPRLLQGHKVCPMVFARMHRNCEMNRNIPDEKQKLVIGFAMLLV